MINISRIQTTLQHRGRQDRFPAGIFVGTPVASREDQGVPVPLAHRPNGGTVSELVDQGRAAARQFEENAKRGHDILYVALAKILELDTIVNRSEQHVDEYAKLLAQRRIRITKASQKNRFTPIVKLIFGKIPANNISRYANTLLYASRNDVSARALPEFIGKNGGVARCAALARRGREDTVSLDAKGLETVESLRASSAIELMEHLNSSQWDGFFVIVGEMAPHDEPKFYRAIPVLPKQIRFVLRTLRSMTTVGPG
jgi:hypothetical protein